MAMKIVISDPKNGKTLQRELTEEQAENMYNCKIGEKIDGSKVGLEGYELEITGGSDFCGFPMRKDLDGSLRKKILAVSGIGLKKKDSGIRIRKTIAGNTIYEKTAQINVKVLKTGSEVLFEEKKEEAAEEKAE
ncbi:30S ribosomal protein S6e [Candidatus Woesearchaeota archaeon]|nr:30S ribosomal protein S6e [Candidatus Woesearchaeota archaeon]